MESKPSLKEIMLQRKKEMMDAGNSLTRDVFVSDPYDKVVNCLPQRRKRSILYTDLSPDTKHSNPWDKNHPENPNRVMCILEKLSKYGLLQRFHLKTVQKNELCTKDDVQLIHSLKLYNELEKISHLNSLEKLEKEATKYDAVYFTQGTFESALFALTNAVRLIEDVARGLAHNGIAIIRPPGHHAMHSEFNGYCFFNNVAIGVERCLRKNLVQKVLVLDYDVHHGQGIQQAFYNRKDVLYISIHRYENGTFWPNLPEGNFNYVGEHNGEGFNINIPLNATGLGDEDYLAILFNIILPVAYEFRPDLIVVAAGYDACIGCPEGRMLLTPAFYSHLISHLSGLAEGRIAVCLEGGYFPLSLAHGATLTAKALCGDPCPMLRPTKSVHRSVIETINNVKGVLSCYWNCFSDIVKFDYVSESIMNHLEEHLICIKYFGEIEYGPPYATRDCYPKIDPEYAKYCEGIIKTSTVNYLGAFKGTCYATDKDMLLHKSESASFEKPERLERILNILKEFNSLADCSEIQAANIDVSSWWRQVHTESYLEDVVENKIPQSQDLYCNEHTFKSAIKASQCLLSVVDKVLTSHYTNGIALIRPPGHHASLDSASGFCFINNIAVAANYIIEKYNKSRILIVDFDIHHGNGTQDIFYKSDKVLYISIHRYDKGNFYPSKCSADADFVGDGNGEGYNVNIPFSGGSMGNGEYLAVFQKIVLPIAYSFAPEVVLVSAGFDAGIHDPLGGYKVTPETFGQFIYLLKPLAQGKIILALEGGYNVNTTAYSAVMCIKALLGHPIPTPENAYEFAINKGAVETINKVISIHKRYWPVLQVNKKISDVTMKYKYNRKFSSSIYNEKKFEKINIQVNKLSVNDV